MCGIVGAVARGNVVPVLLEGLRRLEYRGYDSAGIAVVNGSMKRLRSTGRVSELASLADGHGLSGNVGIAHTRWATHGVPSVKNAHPHVSGGVSVVHNGIIENHDGMRRKLQLAGYEFVSDTDTEVIAHLVHSHLATGRGLLEAVRASVAELTGAYAIAVIHETDPTRLVVARMGAPLLLGLGDEGRFAASDASALVQVTQRVIYLEEGDCAELSLEALRVLDAQGRPVERPVQLSRLSRDAVELGDYRHYVQKEIFEQPVAVADTLEMAISAGAALPELVGPDADSALRGIDSVLTIACGTSHHAGMVARYWLESRAGVPCNVEIASEYRYRDSVPSPRTLVVTISQSGETADTIAALKHARSLGMKHTLTVCNVATSAMVRECELAYITRAGVEIGVASTKAFTTQLVGLFLLTLALAQVRGRLSDEDEAEHLKALRHLPVAVQAVLALEPQVIAWSEEFARKENALFLGRGLHYPIALEGALKLKEISYIHAEAYPAGELKHGPLALVTAEMPVVTVAPNDTLIEKLKSNLQEVRARGGELFVFADTDTRIESSDGVHVIRMPEHYGVLSPILHVVPLQLLAYHTACARGTDVDKPRNLAKSVTVE